MELLAPGNIQPLTDSGESMMIYDKLYFIFFVVETCNIRIITQRFFQNISKLRKMRTVVPWLVPLFSFVSEIVSVAPNTTREDKNFTCNAHRAQERVIHFEAWVERVLGLISSPINATVTEYSHLAESRVSTCQVSTFFRKKIFAS